MDLTAHDPHHSETHTHAEGHDHHHHPKDRPGGATLNASYVVAFLLAGLLIAAVNFIGVMGSEHHGEKGSVHQTQDATSNQSLHGEDGLGADKAAPTQHGHSESNESNAQHEGHVR